jgi:hypothetical protein
MPEVIYRVRSSMNIDMSHPMHEFASGIRGLAMTRGLGRLFHPEDTRLVQGDRAELKRRFLILIENIGDASSWNDGRLKNLTAFAIANGLATASEVKRIQAMHGLAGC